MRNFPGATAGFRLAVFSIPPATASSLFETTPFGEIAPINHNSACLEIILCASPEIVTQRIAFMPLECNRHSTEALWARSVGAAGGSISAYLFLDRSGSKAHKPLLFGRANIFAILVPGR